MDENIPDQAANALAIRPSKNIRTQSQDAPPTDRPVPITLDTPWFIGCGFMKPHDPFIAPKKYFDLYPPASLKHWRDPEASTTARKDAVGFGAYAETFAKITDQDGRLGWG